MTIPFHPDNDLAETVDGLEVVTLRRRGSSRTTVITHALRRGLTTREAGLHNRYDTWKNGIPGGGHHAASDVAWHLPTAGLSDAPRLGDLIVDGQGQQWTILGVQRATLGSRWRCTTRNLAVAHGLDDTVNILKAEYAKGDGGAAVPAWHVWRTGIRARIQPAEVDVKTNNEARQTTARMRIIVEEDLPLNHNHRIASSDGTVYRIRGTLGASRIGELQTIDAERIEQYT